MHPYLCYEYWQQRGTFSVHVVLKHTQAKNAKTKNILTLDILVMDMVTYLGDL